MREEVLQCFRVRSMMPLMRDTSYKRSAAESKLNSKKYDFVYQGELPCPVLVFTVIEDTPALS